jgi:hypothetical protein
VDAFSFRNRGRDGKWIFKNLRMPSKKSRVRDSSAFSSIPRRKQFKLNFILRFGINNSGVRQTAYHRAKQIEATLGAPERNGDVLVPGYDVDGKLWTLQHIKEDGTKRFAKNSHKHGCFHVVGRAELRGSHSESQGAVLSYAATCNENVQKCIVVLHTIVQSPLLQRPNPLGPLPTNTSIERQFAQDGCLPFHRLT